MAFPRALIAEDEPLLAQALQADLARCWPELQVVAAVGDGPQALKAAMSQAPELCFLDIRMPGMSGLEVAQALAEDWPDNGPPFPLLGSRTWMCAIAAPARAASIAASAISSGVTGTCSLRPAVSPAPVTAQVTKTSQFTVQMVNLECT